MRITAPILDTPEFARWWPLRKTARFTLTGPVDGMARTIASWWASPAMADAPLAALATGADFDPAELAGVIWRDIDLAADEFRPQLEWLARWAEWHTYPDEGPVGAAEDSSQNL